MSGPAYLMEDPREAERLEAKTDERLSRRQLRLAGLRPGMRVLDAGCATGAVARTMASLTGPGGRVVALDQSTQLLTHGRALAKKAGLKNVTFVEGSLYDIPLPGGSLDLVWSRFVFEYLDNPLAALKEFLRVLRPGGKVIVGDLDGYGLFHHPISPALERDLKKLMGALAGRFDPFVGRKLYHYFRAAGLQRLTVHAEPYHLYPGVAPTWAVRNWETKLEILRSRGEKAFGGERRYTRFIRVFLDLLRRDDTLSYSVFFLVGGHRDSGA